MCGIVGYIGKRQAYPVLIKGLKRLEYRGYDSAGVALINKQGNLHIYKTKGKVSDLEAFASDKDQSGTIGIAHTRWATHGEPNTRNAHPHFSSSEQLAIIHNGIIENYASIKKSLQAEGIDFQSDTDTEVLVQFIEYTKKKHDIDLLTAVRMVLNVVVGAYAIAILDKANPDQIIAARKSSPLVIGIGKESQEFFIGSDASPLIEFTNRVVYLNDGEIAVINRHKDDIDIVNIKNETIAHKIEEISLSLSEIEKGGYDHFMLKEIFEQPRCLRECMSGRIIDNKSNIVLSSVLDYRSKLINPRRIIIVACGTSWHAGLIGKQLIESICNIPVEVDYASEFRYSNPVIDARDVVIAISQSGETADTLAALELAKDKGAFIFGVCNAVGSSIARATETGCYIHVGPEIGVASTKAFTGQVSVLALIALAIGKARGTIAHNEAADLISELSEIPNKIEQALKTNDKIAEIAKTFTFAHNFLYLGRGYNYPVALEGALKLKEISYIHAEGYPAAEMKHGPIALVDEQMPVVVIATHNSLYDKLMSNIQEIKSRKGRVFAIITEGDEKAKSIADAYVEIPKTKECLEPLLTTIPLQLLAYHIAINKGLNVDQPRNLAKSVTVE